MSVRRGTLAWMITLRSAGFLVAFTVLAASLMLFTSRMRVMTNRMAVDRSQLEIAYNLEHAVLAELREEQILAALGAARRNDTDRLQRVEVWLAEADQLVARLERGAISADEAACVAQLDSAYQTFRAAAEARQGLILSSSSNGVEALLKNLTDYRYINQRQMDATMAEGAELNAIVRTWTIYVLLGVTIAVLVSGFMVWQRIINPVLNLSRAATAFGQGNLQTRISPIPDDEIGTLCTVFNTMAEHLQHRERERLNFIAAVTHDLKNPLMVIGGAARLMAGRPMEESRKQNWLLKIIANVERLEGMTHDLMDSVQADTQGLVLQLEAIDLAAVVRGGTESIGDLAAARTIEFVASEEILMQGDRKRLERVVVNLVSNAIKYSTDGSRIRVEAARVEDRGVIIVEDQGAGITPEELEQLFRPFARVERTSHMARGTGLGLYSVKRIVEEHGGSITMTSAVGKGTTATIVLPLEPTNARSSAVGTER